MKFTLTYMKQAGLNDLEPAVNIIKSAKKYLASHNIYQWQNGYPSRQTISNDIKNKNCYVLMTDNKVAGTVALVKGPNPLYQHLNSGHWLNANQDYLVIHRSAIAQGYRGHQLSRILFSDIVTIALQRGFKDIRIDTNPKNHKMQKIILNNDFKKMGTIIDTPNLNKHRSHNPVYQLLL